MDGPRVDALFLNKQDVDALITYEDVVEAVEAAFRSDGMGRLLTPSKELMPMGGRNFLFAMPGCLYDLGVAGVKWTNAYHGGAYPTCWAHVLVLSHVEDGQPFAILDATSITNMRTAGGHAVVAARHLARKDAKVLGILGCGFQGKSAIRSFTRAMKLERVRVYSSPRSMERCRAELEGEIDVPIEYLSSPRAMAEESDIIVSATGAAEPLLREEWIPEGCTVCAMSSFEDIDPALSARADKWVLGQMDSDREEILERPGIREQVNPADVYGTLGEIICGKKPGRESDRERIVFSHMGMGALDVAVGVRLVEKARARGVGTLLRLT